MRVRPRKSYKGTRGQARSFKRMKTSITSWSLRVAIREINKEVT